MCFLWETLLSEPADSYGSTDLSQFQIELGLHHPSPVRFWVSGKSHEMPSLMGIWLWATLNNVETLVLERRKLEIQESSRENIKKTQTQERKNW